MKNVNRSITSGSQEHGKSIEFHLSYFVLGVRKLTIKGP